jgi:hypothetical protein
MQINPITKEINMKICQKIKVDLSYDPTTAHLGIDKKRVNHMFIVALFTVTKLKNQLKCPTTHEWINNIISYNIYVEYRILLSHKEKYNN